MNKISPCLWFTDEAEEAARFYVSIFKRRSKLVNIMRYGDAGPGPKGEVMLVTFELDGEEFTALNGNPEFKSTMAVSLMVKCKSQAEVDTLWNKLSAGGKKIACGWLTDKYGVTWQIVPTVLMQMLQDKDEKKVTRVMREMMKMDKLNIAPLKRASKQLKKSLTRRKK